jgi:hypothetical protein
MKIFSAEIIKSNAAALGLWERGFCRADFLGVSHRE